MLAPRLEAMVSKVILLVGVQGLFLITGCFVTLTIRVLCDGLATRVLDSGGFALLEELFLVGSSDLCLAMPPSSGWVVDIEE
jgi:hypothetical protein